MPQFPPCHRTVRVTTFTFQFLPSVLHCHTTLGQQNGNSVYLVQEGVSAELFHLFMKLKKHLDIYLKLHNTENMFLICSICRMTCCNNHLQHSAFTLPAAAAHDPGHLHHHSVVCSVHHVQYAALLFIWTQFSWFAGRGLLGNMSHGHNSGNTFSYNH